jgi:hypothetical protein
VEISIGMDLEMVRCAERGKRHDGAWRRHDAPRELVRDALEKGNARAFRAFSPVNRLC